ncbi:hypothetical protein [Shewanella vesiculosa]|jgi:uncharacterized protein (DUF2384 family)|uniref:hypothetical protein n=1 Tax=Shewanella vesiculosa TaxID=518738 RepID=UPI00384C2A1B
MESEILKSVKENHPEVYRELIEFCKIEVYAEIWLKNPHWVLHHKTPLDVLDESPESVMDLLNTLKRGDFS